MSFITNLRILIIILILTQGIIKLHLLQRGYMRCREIIARQILRVLRDLGDQKPKLTGIEFVRDENGVITGYRFEVKSQKETPKLTIINGSKNPSPSS